MSNKTVKLKTSIYFRLDSSCVNLHSPRDFRLPVLQRVQRERRRQPEGGQRHPLLLPLQTGNVSPRLAGKWHISPYFKSWIIVSSAYLIIFRYISEKQPSLNVSFPGTRRVLRLQQPGPGGPEVRACHLHRSDASGSWFVQFKLK